MANVFSTTINKIFKTLFKNIENLSVSADRYNSKGAYTIYIFLMYCRNKLTKNSKIDEILIL